MQIYRAPDYISMVYLTSGVRMAIVHFSNVAVYYLIKGKFGRIQQPTIFYKP